MSENKSRFRSLLAEHGGTALILAVLAAVAIWGHHTGWKAPSFSEMTGSSAPEAKEDWCEAHNVPASKCLACNPELAGEDPTDWCKEHGVPESKCTVCHPEILTQGTASDWCNEHGVPESQCTICHPEVAYKGEAPGSDATPTVSADPNADRAQNSPTCQTHLVRIQFASAEAVRKAGVELESVRERPVSASVGAPGEIRYDQTRVAKLAARADGIAWRVERKIGERVKQGDLLALVDAAEVGEAKAALLHALASVDVESAHIARLRASLEQTEEVVAVKRRVLERVTASTKEGFRSQGDLQDAEAAVAEAMVEVQRGTTELQSAEAALREARIQVFTTQQRLTNLGLTVDLDALAGLSDDELIARVRLLGIPETVTTSLGNVTNANLVPVVAPFDGVVVAREVVEGESVDSSAPMFVVADLSQMWLELDVRQEDASRVAIGQRVVFRRDGERGRAVEGAVSWISSEVDDTTRTVAVRATVQNPDGDLRANAFGTGRVVVRESPTAVVVPDEAVHWEGCCHVVFVRMTDEIFQTRKVRIGARTAGLTEITVGLLAGEVVATKGSHVLKSELLKSKLGAGCVDD